MKKVLFLCLVLVSSMFASKNIDVYTYHNHLPFIVDKKSGMSYELINFLNKKLKGEYKFTLRVIPRSRLNYLLKPWINKECNSGNCEKNWMVLWVNHKWGFGSDSLTNFYWVKLFEDSNSIIYSKEKPVEYQSPSSLIGKKLVGIAGHKYVGIDDLAKEGKITRIDGQSEENNLLKVMLHRVDVTLLPTSTFDYYKQNSKYDSLQKAKVKHQVYMRNIMIPRVNGKLYKALEKLDYESVVQ